MSHAIERVKDWDTFGRRNWKRAPAMVEGGSASRPLLRSDELFRLLLTASDLERSKELPRMRFYLDRSELLSRRDAPHLARRQDRTLERYAERVARRVAPRRFGLFLNHAHRFAPSLSARLREFLVPLYQAIGIPLGPVEPGLFLGNYRATPLGAHMDGASVFMFCLHGRRRVLLWDGARYQHRLHGTFPETYRRYESRAVVVEAGPGDIVYWPSTSLHVVESIGFSASLSLALYPQRAHEVVSTAIGKLLGSAIPRDEAHLPFRPGDPGPPAALVRSARKLASLARRPAARQALATAWLQQLSSLGIEVFPDVLPVEPSRLGARDRIQLNPGSSLACLPWGPDEVLCAGNGHVVAVPRHPGMIAAMRQLNEGDVIRIDALVSAYRARLRRREDFTEHRATLLGLLNELYRTRVLSRVPAR